MLVLAAGCRSTPSGGKFAPQQTDDAVSEPAELAPLPSRWKVRFRGNDSISSDTLRQAIELGIQDWIASDLAEAFIDDAAFDVELHYKSRGYPKAQVDYALAQEGERVTATFKVIEGPYALIEGIKSEVICVEGDKPVFSRDEIAAVYDGPITGLFGLGLPVFVQSDVDDLPDSIAGALIDRGYAEAKVEAPQVSFDKTGRRAQVQLRITQGPRYSIGSIELAEGVVMPDELRGGHRDAMQMIAKQDVWYPRLPFELQGLLYDLLAKAGFPDARVEAHPILNEEHHVVDLMVHVVPGPRVTIADILFEGNEQSRASFLRSRMRLEVGAPFDNEALRDSVRRLYKTGLFGRVDASLEKSQDSERDLVVRLEELPTLELFIEPGWGSYEEARITLGAREKNLGGRGLRLTAEGTLATRARRAQIALTDPWFLSRELIGGLSVSYKEREEPSFTRIESAITPSVTLEWGRRDSTNLAYRFEESRAVDVEILRVVEEIDIDSVGTSSIIVTQEHDRRDGIIAPVGGHTMRASLEFADNAIGSQFDFVRGLFDFEHYLNVREGTVLASGFRTGVILPYNNEETPLQQRFFNGGENTVRSFMQSQLGPKDTDGNPIGGEAFTTVNLELRQDVGATHVQVAAFMDAGNVALRQQEYFDFRDLSYGLGLGLRYMLPIGPLRLDGAVNPDTDDGDEEFVLHFAIGMAF
ncbi:MAG: outer membrane protein insertion porin family [Planctomycetota bacterium]|jgi:outer membrane protein insertion porin family